MLRDERGVALPIVIALSTILFLIATVAISQSLRSRHAATLHWEMIGANYASESGIARAQAQLQGGHYKKCNTFKEGYYTVRTQIQISPLQVTTTAYGRFGVKQTVTAQLSPVSFQVIRWIK